MADTAGSALIAALLVVANLVCVVAVAVRVARAVSDDGWDRALIAAVIGIAQASGVALLLAMLTIATRFAATAAHVAIAAVVLSLVRPNATESGREGSLATRLGAALGAALAVPAVAPALRALQSAHGETRHYHISNLATWLRLKTLWTLPFQNVGVPTATHPGNAEMLGLWLVMPSHGDEIAYLVILPFAILAVLASASIARGLGGEPGWGALCATALLAAPHVFRTHGYALTSDLPAAAGLAAGIAFLLRAREDRRPVWLLLAGVGLGLGIGSKYTVLLPGAVVLGWAAVSERRIRRIALLLPGLLLLAAPWFVRNAVETGNPVFPEGVRIAGREIFPAAETPFQQLSTTIADHFVHGRTDVMRRWTRLTARVWGPVVLLAIAGVVAAFRRHELRRPRLIVAGFALVCAGTYAILPLSGGGPRGLEFLIGSNLRYLLPALLLGVAIAAAAAPAWLRGVLTAAAVAYGLGKVVQGTRLRPDLELRWWIVLASIVAAIAASLIAGRGNRITPRRSTVVVAVVAAVIACWAVVWHGARDMQPTQLELAVQSVAGDAPVVVLGVNDLRSILGERLDRTLVGLADGGAANERPFADGDRLSRALDRSPWNVLVVPNVAGAAALPPAWRPPPTWRRARTVGTVDVYVRA